MMRQISITLALFFSLISPFKANVTTISEPLNPVNVYMFYVDGCSNCASEKTYLELLRVEYPNIEIIRYHIATEFPENNTLLNEVASVFNEDQISTPFTVIGGKHYVGFNSFVQSQLEKYHKKYSENDFVDIMAKILNNEVVLESDFDTSNEYEYNLPILGTIDIRTFSLGAIAIVLGVVDGFNPCATWVLIFLISLLLPTKSKKKMLLIGGVFLLVSAAFYFGIMMAWIETVSLISAKKVFQTMIGIFAIGAALFNLYSYYQSRKRQDVGCEVTNEKQRDKLMARIRNIVNQRNILLALIGTVGLAVIVNLIELACSSGLPVIFSQILAINGISGINAVMLTLLYVLFFLIDDLIIFIPVILTMKVSGISSKYSRYTHLIGGLFMLAIGILMLFFPNIIMFNI